MTINATQSSQISPKTYRIGQGKGTYVGPIYEGFKQVARTYGFYKDIEPYLPEELIQKPFKKPVTTSLDFQRAIQKIIPKKTRFPRTYRKQYQECGFRLLGSYRC